MEQALISFYHTTWEMVWMRRRVELHAIGWITVVVMLLTLLTAGSTARAEDAPLQREVQLRRALPPGVLEDRPIQGFEYETAQAGGTGYGRYSSIGSLRCP